jgi:potassium-transporting ATPase KdpC subunit
MKETFGRLRRLGSEARAHLLLAARLTAVIALLTGLIYPLAITGVAQLFFRGQADGSMVAYNGRVIGSTLIGQEFTSPAYFHGRVSVTVNPATGEPEPYAADNSNGSDLGPTNRELIQRIKRDAAQVRRENGLAPNARIPIDLVTSSFSGLDPDITEASALIQVDRVARARGLPAARVRALVESHVQGRVLGIFGEPSVNVLELNLALDQGAAG